MISQPMSNEAVVVLTPNGIRFPQTGGPKPTSQRRYSLVKQLKAEVKVLGVSSIQNMLEWDGGGRVLERKCSLGTTSWIWRLLSFARGTLGSWADQWKPFAEPSKPSPDIRRWCFSPILNTSNWVFVGFCIFAIAHFPTFSSCKKKSLSFFIF